MGGKPRRRRLPAAEARAAILDAAEGMLIERGPDGIRLQELAADLGISHPAILHHFGSRAGLLRALVERTGERLQQELIDTITRGVDQDVAAGVLERSFEVLADRKHARTLAWLNLSPEAGGGPPVGHGAQLRRIADVAHALRVQRHPGRDIPYEDTLYTVSLAGMALFGHAIAGARLQDEAGVDSRKFLRWLTRLLLDHLDS
ncbi:MAG TPA: TetR/AcrR family transcriptional regulator [Kofleriaceae bacterium]|jgi:AcrR family transcriptional regulator|nr:TetR/AcrR family transcriptional regulator [Kofleriaceae bacterium]